MELVVQPFESLPNRQDIEIVERKGLGHPDTLCDAIAERICVRLCRWYLDRFDTVLHHNVDKVLLCAGASRPSFGGGDVLEPMEIYLGGRATQEWRGVTIPVHEIAVDACRSVLRERVPEVDVDRHVRIVPRIRAGSTDLTRLFARGGTMPLANDTSCASGFAPLTDLERVVLEVERRLSGIESREANPAIGSDVKVMGVRQREHIMLTIGCAFVARHVASLDEYVRKKAAARALVMEVARTTTPLHVEATLNAADDLSRGDVYLTVTGTSAEAGDDGEVGRGNRTNGLITPYRFMTMEAAAGKNPMNHVGKLYNVVAERIAAELVTGLDGVQAAACVLVSQIGHVIDDPQVADIRLAMNETTLIDRVRAQTETVVHDQLGRLSEIRQALIDERLTVY